MRARRVQLGDVGVGAVGQPAVERLRRRGPGLGQAKISGDPGRRPRSGRVARRGCRRRPARRAAGSRSARSGGRRRGAAAGGCRRAGRRVRPRCPVSSRWMRRRTSSTAANPRRTTWKASSTRTACGRAVRSARGVAAVGVQRGDGDAARQPASRSAHPADQRRCAAVGDDIEQRRPAARVRSTMPVTKLVERVPTQPGTRSRPPRGPRPRPGGRGRPHAACRGRGPRPSRCPSRSRNRGPPPRPRHHPHRPADTPLPGPARSATPAATISRDVSVQVLVGHSWCGHRHTRLTHTSVTGRPAAAGPAPTTGADHAAARPPRTRAADQIRGGLHSLLQLAVVLGHRQHDEPRQAQHRRRALRSRSTWGLPFRVLDTTDHEAPGPSPGPS